MVGDCDFEIELIGTPGRYLAQVRSPAGECNTEIALDPAGLADQLRVQLAGVSGAAEASTRLVRDVRVAAAPAENPLRQVGAALFDAVLSGEAGTLFRSSRNLVERREQLRVVLRLPAELAVLPWESLYDARNDEYVCQRDGLIRYVAAPEPVRPLAVDPPLRIVGMTALPADLAPLDADAERRKLTEALAPLTRDGLVKLDWVDGQRFADVQRAMLDGCHVFHFIGHGDFDADAREGVVAFAGDDHQAQLVTAASLTGLLSVADPMPRLVVLNSCRTAAGDATDVFSSVGATLVRRIPAVVAMQFPITDQAAKAFSEAFYAALARDRGVDQAVRTGRIAILGTARETLEWVTPVLYMRSSQAQLFTVGSRRRPPEPVPSPYRGLAALREADAAVFHGREAESEELAGLVRGNPLVTMVGPSGCGKSSLAMAGVVPRLRASGHAVVVMRPAAGSSPLASLAAGLLSLLEPALSETDRLARISVLADTLAAHGITDAAARVLELTGAGHLLVLVDQCEELMTQPPEAVEALAGVLFPANPPEALRVLVTLRADFLDEALLHPALGPNLRRRVWALGPMSREALRQVVVGPVADLAGVGYEPGLVEKILDDTGEASGALPLLAFALALLWEQRTDGKLTFHAYDEIGGVAGALGKYAEQVWREHVPEPDVGAARGLFTQLVRVPLDGTAVTRRMATSAELDPREWEIGRRLATTRLLVTGRDAEGDETVELAHEALIAGWSRLRGWVEADRDFLGWREALRQDRERWQRGGHDPALLPTEVALAVARRWTAERRADLTADEVEYLERGAAYRRSTARRRRALTSGVAAVLVLALTFGVLYVQQRRFAAGQKATADAGALALASGNLSTRDPVTSIMLALAAYQRRPQLLEARDALFRRYAEYTWADRLLSSPIGGDVATVQTSIDGDVVLTRSNAGRATVFVRGADDRVRTQVLDTPGQAVYPAVAPNGRRIALVALDGSVVWYDVADGGGARDERILSAPHTAARAPRPAADNNAFDDTHIALSPSGRFLAAVIGGQIVWWDLTAGRLGGTIERKANLGEYGHVWFGANDATIVASAQRELPGSGTTETRIVRVDRVTGTPQLITKDVDVLFSYQSPAALLAGGTAVAVCEKKGKVISYVSHRVSDGTEIGRYRTDDVGCADFAADPTGPRIAIMRGGDAWLSVDLLRGKEVSRTAAGTDTFGDRLHGTLVRTGGSLYVVAYQDAQVVFQKLNDTAVQTQVSQAALTADARRVISVTERGDRIQVQADDGKQFVSAARPQPAWLPTDDRLRLNPDGKLVVDRVGKQTVDVREVASLRRLAEVTASREPVQPDRFSYFFGVDGMLVTVSGNLVERWDPRTGRSAGRVDLSAAGVTKNQKDDVGGTYSVEVTSYPQPGRVAVVVPGDEDIHVVDVLSGRAVSTISVGANAAAATFDPSGEAFALLRRGSAVELWRRDPPRREIGPLPSIGHGESHQFVDRFLDKPGRFLLADNDKIWIYQVGEGTPVESLDLGVGGYSFFDASRDGSTLLYARSSGDGGMLSLRPATWRHGLCEIIGRRELTEAERQGLPDGVPAGRLCG